MMTQRTDNRDPALAAAEKKKKVFVLGATGGTGSAVVARALTRGHEVRAFVRAPERMGPHSHLTVTQGDPHDTSSLTQAMVGSDLVVSALGRRDDRDPTLLADCMQATLAAMKKANVSRLLVVSSALLFSDVGLLGAFLKRFVFALALSDSARMEALVTASAFDWTIVRPPRLLDGSGTKTFRERENHLPAGGRSIARVDLARFLVDETEHHRHTCAIVGVAS